MSIYGSLKVFSGRAHPTLGQEICRILGIEPGNERPGELTLARGADGPELAGCAIRGPGRAEPIATCPVNPDTDAAASVEEQVIASRLLRTWGRPESEVAEIMSEVARLQSVESLADAAVWVDKWVVDGIVARLTAFVVSASGTLLRYLQTGRVQAYASVMVIETVATFESRAPSYALYVNESAMASPPSCT